MPARTPVVERRSRIVCHFPMNRLPDPLKPNQMRVVHQFIKFLKQTTLTGFWRPTIADVPGLIEGASSGAGLGHAFLRHVERTRVLVHVVDGSASDPERDHEVIRDELAAHDPRLLQKPILVAFNKLDLPAARAAWPAFRDRRRTEGLPVLAIAAATGEGIPELRARLAELLPPADELAGAAELAQGKLGGRPFAVARGRADLVLPVGDDGPGASALVRPDGSDLFGFGAREAVLRALLGDPGDAAAFGAPSDTTELAELVERLGAAVRTEDDSLVVTGGVDAVALRALAFAHGWELEPADDSRRVRLRPRGTSP